MPKLKTNKGTAKRFKPAGKGSFKHRRGFRNHILTSKSHKRKRQLRANKLVHSSDLQSIARLINGS